MQRRIRCLILALLLSPASIRAEEPPDMGSAPPFRLMTQDGAPLSLADLRGKVVLVAFIYASCRDTCITETAKMVVAQNKLGGDFGKRVYFLSVTMDPARDTASVLREHALKFGARLDGWAFLTGTPAAVRRVARDYGVAYRKKAPGDVEHNTLASIIDGAGHLRMQYLGVEFDPDELVADLRRLARKEGY